MAEVADEIADAAEGIQDSEFFDEILNVIIEVQEEVEKVTSVTCSGGSMNGEACASDADCPGGSCSSDLVLGGACNGGTNDGGGCASNADCPGGECTGGIIVPTPTGALQVNYVCPGWDEGQFEAADDAEPDPANGTIDLFLSLERGTIGRVVWGGADQCQYLIPLEGDDCESAGCLEGSYDGSVALDLGPDWVSGDVEELPVTFVVEGSIGVDGNEYRVNQSFRVVLAVESGLVILVDVGDPALTETFNYIFAETGQGIRDATGLFGCSLEESRCFDESGTLFEW